MVTIMPLAITPVQPTNDKLHIHEAYRINLKREVLHRQIVYFSLKTPLKGNLFQDLILPPGNL